MKIYTEINPEDFEAWSGGEDTLNAIIEADKIDEFEALLIDLYPDGIDETTLNDLLRFDYEWLLETLDIEEEEEEDF